MKVRIFLSSLSVILLSTTKPFAQIKQKSDDVIIHIDAERLEQTRSMDIYRYLDEIKIVYASSDSIKGVELNTDKEYVKVSDSFMKQIKANNISNATSDSLHMFFDRYRAYDRDSITFKVNTDTAYNNLLNRVINAPDEELLQQKKNAGRITLDGIVISFKIIKESKERSLYANSPNAKSHPLLYHLVKRTSKISLEKNLKVKGFFWY